MTRFATDLAGSTPSLEGWDSVVWSTRLMDLGESDQYLVGVFFNRLSLSGACEACSLQPVKPSTNKVARKGTVRMK